MKTNLYLSIIISTVLFISSGCTQKESEPIYLFSYFTGNGEDGLHLAYSKDGLHWEVLNNGHSLLEPEVGESKLMRDPCITRGPDGLFHMVWTTSWKGKTIGYAHSKDLVHWSEQKAFPVMIHEPNAQNCWAPEINYDEKSQSFYIYWSTTITDKFPETANSTDNGAKRNHRIYYTTTKDFESFSDTELYYEPGFNVIDASIVDDGDKYVMFIKDETKLPEPKKHILVTTSDHIDGPWSEPYGPITGDYWAEGPTAIKINGKWHVYFDKYRKDHFGLITSTDLKNWEEETEKLSMPEGIRHGTVFKVDKDLIEGLTE